VLEHHLYCHTQASFELVQSLGTPHGYSVAHEGKHEDQADLWSLDLVKKCTPDIESVADIVVSGDDVIVRARVTGSHRGVAKMPLNNMPVGAAATGKRFEVSHIHWHALRKGQIVEHYANRDDLGMLRQLGLLSVAATQ
jgi:hypothetical protein